MVENNRKTRYLFKKIRDTKATFHAKMGTIKDRNGMDLTEAEDTKNMWQKYTESESESRSVMSNSFWPHGLYQFSSVTQSCPTLCDPMNHITPGLPVHHHLPEFTQTHIHRVSDAIQPSDPLASPCFPGPNPSKNQILFQWVNSSHEVAKVLEFQL